MNPPLLCVCLRPVWRTDVPVRLAAGGHAPRAEEALLALGAAERAALQLALELRAASAVGGGGSPHVLALCVGPPAAEDALREALAAGVDEVLRVWGPDAGDAAPVPQASAAGTRGRAQAAAHALRARTPALVLCGDRSADTAQECFGAWLAAELGAAFAHRVTALRRDGAEWEATALLERGYGQVLRLGSPAVVTVSARLPGPPPAPLPAWLASRSAAVPLLELPAGVGSASDPGAGTLRVPRPRVKISPVAGQGRSAEERIQALVTMEAGGGGMVLAGDSPAAQADAVLRLLRERGYVR